jgi:HEAT repeat protein
MLTAKSSILLAGFLVFSVPASLIGSQSDHTPKPAPTAPTPQTDKATAAKAPEANPVTAWDLLTQEANSDRFRDRSDALSALTILDRDRRAIAVISNALSDKDETIRMLAATSLGDIKAKSAIPKLKIALDDRSPQVSFAVAQALWKMGDRSGRDIFYEVLDGERKVTPSPIKQKIRQARLDMHDPKAVALIGVNEASSAFLGPFSMGVSMVEEYAKGGGTSVQALCAQMLASDDNRDTAHELMFALGDKNWAVRAAAARAIAKLDDRQALPQLKDMMQNDKSQPARFAAAAAVIRLSGPSAPWGKGAPPSFKEPDSSPTAPLENPGKNTTALN